MMNEMDCFKRLSTMRWLSAFFLDWVVIVIVMWVAVVSTESLSGYASMLALFACVFIVGTRQHAIAILAHDASHGLASENSRFGKVLAILALLPLGASLEGYVRFHRRHHETVGTPLDPELEHKNAPVLGQWTVPLRPWRLSGLILLDFFGGGVPHVMRIMMLTKPVSIWGGMGIASFFAVAIVSFAWAGLLVVPIVWIGSLLSSFWMCFRMRIWTEHVGVRLPDRTHRISVDGFFGLIARLWFLPHNAWCHWEHHQAFDEDRVPIPFYRLPQFGERFRLPEPVPVWTLFSRLQK